VVVLWSAAREVGQVLFVLHKERGGYSHIYFPLDFEEVICEILRVNACRVNAETVE
jgi:predicted transcriptional regulator